MEMEVGKIWGGERLLGVYFRYWVFGADSWGGMYCRLEEEIEVMV